ncbi:MAG: hypothetical protein ISQ28_07925 [Alphaproteobacteria bacterium]|nr:hypothetical protein [Alphaproteobacteria bacterium]
MTGKNQFSGIAKAFALAAVACVASVLVSGCTTVTDLEANQIGDRDAVMPISLGERAFVRPEAMAKGLIQAGLSSEYVLQFGPYLMEMIAAEGGAELYISGRLIFALAVFDDDLFITSMERGLTVVRDAA